MTRLHKPLPAPFEERLRQLRSQLEGAFSDDTAAPGFPRSSKSAGQCAAVAVVLHFDFGAARASANVHGLSHWFNRLRVGHTAMDVDLTGDQFGRPEIQAEPAGRLYPHTSAREASELQKETLERAERLAARAGLEDVRAKIAEELAARSAEETSNRA